MAHTAPCVRSAGSLHVTQCGLSLERLNLPLVHLATPSTVVRQAESFKQKSPRTGQLPRCLVAGSLAYRRLEGEWLKYRFVGVSKVAIVGCVLLGAQFTKTLLRELMFRLEDDLKEWDQFEYVKHCSLQPSPTACIQTPASLPRW